MQIEENKQKSFQLDDDDDDDDDDFDWGEDVKVEPMAGGVKKDGYGYQSPSHSNIKDSRSLETSAPIDLIPQVGPQNAAAPPTHLYNNSQDPALNSSELEGTKYTPMEEFKIELDDDSQIRRRDTSELMVDMEDHLGRNSSMLKQEESMDSLSK